MEMMTTSTRLLVNLAFAASVVAAGLAIGCDPVGPGAQGTITLAEEVEFDASRRLEVRIHPAGQSAYDPKVTLADDLEIHAKGTGVSRAAFPLRYNVDTDVGTTETKRWRVVAWLHDSIAPSDANQPVEGQWYGTRTFELLTCQGFGGYCNVTTEVDFAIDKKVEEEGAEDEVDETEE